VAGLQDNLLWLFGSSGKHMEVEYFRLKNGADMSQTTGVALFKWCQAVKGKKGKKAKAWYLI